MKHAPPHFSKLCIPLAHANTNTTHYQAPPDIRHAHHRYARGFQNKVHPTPQTKQRALLAAERKAVGQDDGTAVEGDVADANVKRPARIPTLAQQDLVVHQLDKHRIAGSRAPQRNPQPVRQPLCVSGLEGLRWLRPVAHCAVYGPRAQAASCGSPRMLSVFIMTLMTEVAEVCAEYT